MLWVSFPPRQYCLFDTWTLIRKLKLKNPTWIGKDIITIAATVFAIILGDHLCKNETAWTRYLVFLLHFFIFYFYFLFFTLSTTVILFRSLLYLKKAPPPPLKNRIVLLPHQKAHQKALKRRVCFDFFALCLSRFWFQNITAPFQFVCFRLGEGIVIR